VLRVGCESCPHCCRGISHATDAKLGTGPDAVCMQCHTPGDACDQARAGFQSGLSRLDDAIRGADQALGVAESSGMEVSEARLAQDQARDSLTKARVTIHSFRTDLVDQDIQAGLKIAFKNLQAGKNAMIEGNHRRLLGTLPRCDRFSVDWTPALHQAHRKLAPVKSLRFVFSRFCTNPRFACLS
jgi:hypothetical protein